MVGVGTLVGMLVGVLVGAAVGGGQPLVKVWVRPGLVQYRSYSIGFRGVG